MAKKPRNPLKQMKDGKEVWKTKELLQAGSALAQLAGGKDYAKNIRSFDEQDTESAGGKRETNPDKKKSKTGFNVEQGGN